MRTATSASGGREQLSADIDCLVTDYDMPGENGIEFLESVRATYPDLPVILFTSKDSPAIAQEALTAGMDGYLRKSGHSETYRLLMSEICALVEKAQVEQQSAHSLE